MFNNNDIFKFLNPTSNDNLNNLKGEELQELIRLLKRYYIELRDEIGIDDYVTFGLEIEIEHTDWDLINKKVKRIHLDKEWNMTKDDSLNDGVEITSPILIDEKKSWGELRQICESVKKYAKIGKNSGGHIHVGCQTLGKNIDSLLNFIKLWIVYENVIYRYGYGEYLNPRPSLVRYSYPRRKELYEDYLYFLKNNVGWDEMIERLTHLRNSGVNFDNVKYSNSYYEVYDTFEFRCPNGSLDPVIWQNNINLFVKLLLYSKSNKIDNDIIEKRLKEMDEKVVKLKLYEEIYLEQALELADMIFTNNLDKINFLKQYLKSFKVNSNYTYKIGPRLTKKSRI